MYISCVRVCVSMSTCLVCGCGGPSPALNTLSHCDAAGGAVGCLGGSPLPSAGNLCVPHSVTVTFNFTVGPQVDFCTGTVRSGLSSPRASRSLRELLTEAC